MAACALATPAGGDSHGQQHGDNKGHDQQQGGGFANQGHGQQEHGHQGHEQQGHQGGGHEQGHHWSKLHI